jgi:hypothetical protein
VDGGSSSGEGRREGRRQDIPATPRREASSPRQAASERAEPDRLLNDGLPILHAVLCRAQIEQDASI